MAGIPDAGSSFEKAEKYSGSGDDKNAEEGRDPATGQFLAGRRGVGGRKKGARARWSEDFMADIEAAWKEQGRSVIDRAMFHDPAGTLKALIGILPRHAKLEIISPVDGLSDETLEALLIYAEQRIAEANTIEGSATAVTPLAPAAQPVADEVLFTQPTRHPGRDADKERQRRDLLDQASAAEAAETASPPTSLLPYPVGRPFPVLEHEEERVNRYRLAEAHLDIKPEDLF